MCDLPSPSMTSYRLASNMSFAVGRASGSNLSSSLLSLSFFSFLVSFSLPLILRLSFSPSPFFRRSRRSSALSSASRSHEVGAILQSPPAEEHWLVVDGRRSTVSLTGESSVLRDPDAGTGGARVPAAK